MPRILVDRLLPAGERIRLATPAAHHVTRVLRLGAGDALALFDGRGEERAGQIVEVHAGRVVVEVGEPRTPRSAAPSVAVTLLMGLPKGDKADRIVRATTELGVRSIVFVRTARAAAAATGGKLDRWRRIAAQAARQAQRADLPEIDGPLDLSDAFSGVDATSCRVVLYEEERERRLHTVIGTAAPGRGIALLVGPEGGLSRDEVGQAVRAGFVPVTLGACVLRTETAAIVAVALALELAPAAPGTPGATG